MITTKTKVPCPICKGVAGVEVAPGDWFDCDTCEATGFVSGAIYTKREHLYKWDRRFIEMAEFVASWSKGPRKRIGAVIVRPDRSIASLGYNGPPRGFDDEAFLEMTREEQHKFVIHAEDNALKQMAFSEFGREYDLYVSPLFPCADCAARIIADRRIKRVIAYCGHISDDWRASAQEAERMFSEAGISCLFITD